MLPFSLSSCGGDTKDWPRLKFDLDDVILTSIEIKDFTKDTKTGKIDGNITKKACDKETIRRNIHNIEGYPYQEKTEEGPIRENWIYKTIIKIEGENVSLDIIFINYGISNGLLSFVKNEWHFLPGYFMNLYEEFEI